MYDKSKKTWSQRLKISKNDNSTSSTTSTLIGIAEQQQQQQLTNFGFGHNANISTTTTTTATTTNKNMQAMHLQALQMQQQLNDYHTSGGALPPPGYEYLPSALSRSMKYAEPWIYGTVRGIPARPYHHQMVAAAAATGYGHPHAAAIFAAHPMQHAETALAVVICSCPEYLNGTKRDVKKASVCKKCKGSRLPLATIGTAGGTVRLPAAALTATSTKLRGSATMRVVSTSKKSRPTILDPQKDPYDLMRRSRLLSPEPGVPSAKTGGGSSSSNNASNTANAKESNSKSRNRGKSASPQRGRSRTRAHQLPAKVSNKDAKAKTHDLDDCWLVEDNESLLSASLTPTHSRQHSRRSILRCNVNPYDLISIDNSDANATPTSGKAASKSATSQSGNAANNAMPKASTPATTATATGGTPRTRISASSIASSTASSSQNEFLAPNDDDFNVADAALNEDEPPFATTNGGNSGNSSNNNINQHVASGNDNKAEDELKFYTNNVQAIAGQRISLGDQRATKKSLIKQISDGRHYESIIIGIDDEQPKQQQQQQAKQIIAKNNQTKQQPKRPPRIKKPDVDHETITTTSERNVSTTTIAAVTSDDDVDDDEPITVLTVTPTQSIKSILKRPTTLALEIGQQQQPQQQQQQISLTTPTIPTDKSGVATTTTQANVTTPTTPGAKSQFYIPMPNATTPSSATPTRKKVQFMVEDKIILSTTTTTVDDINSNNSKSDYTEIPKITDVDMNNIKPDDEVNKSDELQSDTDFEVIHIAQKTTNYEYYNRKREQQQQQQRLLEQQQQQIASDLPAVTNANDSLPNYVDFASGLVAQTITKSDDDDDDVAAATKSFAVNNNIKQTDSIHYEDVFIADAVEKILNEETVSSNNNTNNNFNSNNTKNTSNNNDNKNAENLPTTTLNDADPKQSLPGVSSAGTSTQQQQQPTDDADVADKNLVDTTKRQTTDIDNLAKDTTKLTLHHDYDDVVVKQKELPRVPSKEILTTSTKITQTRNPIRRAHSERHLPVSTSLSATTNNNNAIAGKETRQQQLTKQQQQSPNVILNFKDTMALRIKNNRNDSRDLFQRPKEPPPPPPPTPVTPATLATPTIEVVKATTKEETATAAIDATKTLSTTNGLDQQQIQKHNQKEKEYQNQTQNQRQMQQQQQQQSKHQQQQRTVVRVAPFNKTTSEIHRLKISHTDADDGQISTSSMSTSAGFGYYAEQQQLLSSSSGCATDVTQKKTSILINGDDCYSTMNLSSDTAQPLYQSSVVVADPNNNKNNNNSSSNDGCTSVDGLRVTTTSNTVTINVCSPARTSEEELIYQHNKINTLLSRQALDNNGKSVKRAIIPIRGSSNEINLQRSASSTSSASTSSMASTSSSTSSSGDIGSGPKRGRTLIRLDYEKEKQPQPMSTTTIAEAIAETVTTTPAATTSTTTKTLAKTTTTTTHLNSSQELVSHEAELLKILRNPVEAVKRNLVPHICGRGNELAHASAKDTARNKKMKEGNATKLEPSKATASTATASSNSNETNSFIAKLLEDPTLGQVADGLETETIAELIENSLKRLQQTRQSIDISGTKDNEDMNRLINISLQKIKEERQAGEISRSNSGSSSSNSNSSTQHLNVPSAKEEDRHSNRGSISSVNSFASAHNYEMFDFDANESDCYQSCSSELTAAGVLEDDDDGSLAATRTKFYQMLVDATLAEIELSTHNDADVDHHYESIRHNGDPIYEEITDVPPPLPLTAPPLNDPELEKKAARSIFEGASKYDILSYLVDAKERGVAREETFEYPMNCSNPIIIEEEAADTLSELDKRKQLTDRSSRASILSDSSEDNQSTMSSLSPPPHNFMCGNLGGKGAASDIERNDSGVGSETSKTSRSKYQQQQLQQPPTPPAISKNAPLHLCEDCDGPVETQMSESGVMFAPLVCRKCGKKRVERKEIITEIVETEEKYGRDLQIILEEFCHPMLVAGLLTQEQLSAIFLNTEELLENNQTLAERMRDALDIALEQGDDDLLTVNIGRIFLDFTQMLHAFESYCVRQAGASLLLANLEKEKELLRIFLKVSQMENAVLRRMNLNSFLMVPVQRVTKYPLLLARLYKVTPTHLEGRELLKQAQEKIELHLNHINQEAKDVPTKLWRRISSSSPNRRASCEIDMINIKLRKMAIDILEWNHDEVRFAMEGKLLYTQPTDSNWKKARTIKLTPVNALLVTNGKPSANYKAEKVMSDKLNFPKHTGIREASLLVVKEKCGRYTLIREPLYLDRCVVCSEADWDDYFEVQEISSKDTFIFKAEDGVRTKQWYTQLQYHAQGMGAWRKRRNALANIMINGMLTRS